MHKNLLENPTLHSDRLLNEVRCNVSIFEFALQLFQNPHTLSNFLLLIQLLFLVPELMLHIRLCYWYIQTLIYMKKMFIFLWIDQNTAIS